METIEMLEQALGLISQPGAWTINTVGKTASGFYTTADDPRAVAWCALGALEKVSGELWSSHGNHFKDALNVLNLAAVIMYGHEGVSVQASPWDTPFVRYNNSHTQEDVILMFKNAIALCDEEAVL